VKRDRILRLREEKLASEDPEFAAARERTRKQYLSRMAHEFFCGCADCDGEALNTEEKETAQGTTPAP
jgi:hypothetical protein